VEVPAAALMFRTRGPVVAVVDKGGRVRFDAVTIARDDGTKVELGSGIEPGDRIVLNISNQITNGEKVAVTEQDGGVVRAALRER